MAEDRRVLIAGGGIGGFALGLTLQQIGVDCVIFEAAAALKPLGVGINLQPNAVRELQEMGLTRAEMDGFGVPAREWALLGRGGQEIHAEPRGTDAGYRWPQYAAHRGLFHMALHARFVAQAGVARLRLGHRARGYEHNADGSVTLVLETAEGLRRERGALLVGADGIHSAIRAQMHPGQPPIHWGGAMMWRGTTQARPLRGGASFVGLGGARQRMVIYPIGAPDPATGLACVNWIAEVTDEPRAPPGREGWFRQVSHDAVLPHFAGWTYDWLDVPALIAGAETVYANPMIDRDPVPTWVDGPVALLGDAAHAMYPTGSNGAGQAIVDGRVLGACLLAHGVTPQALRAYDAALCGPVSALVLRNRSAGPFGLLDIIEARCGGDFDDIDAVIPAAERRAFMAEYKAAAGFAREALNAAPPTIAPGSRVAGAG